MPESIRLALLICGALAPSVASVTGDYHALYTEFIRKACEAAGGTEFTLGPYNVFEDQVYPRDAADYDGIIIPGSRFSAYQKLDWIDKLVAYVANIIEHQPQVKLFGFCFGHQIIGRALGGECVYSGAWEASVVPVQLIDFGQQIFGKSSIYIHQMHTDHVPEVPPGLHLIGSSPQTHNHGMIQFSSSCEPSDPSSKLRLTDIHILTLQGHPEFTEAVTRGLVADRLSQGKMDAETAEDAQRRADWKNDGVSVAQVVLRICGIGMS